MKLILPLLWFTAVSQWAWSQGTIVHTEGPAFPIPGEFVPATIDLNGDGSADFGFISGFPLCTMDVPTSLCTMSSYAMSLGTNGLLVEGSYASVVSAGQWIGSATASNSLWSTGGNCTLLTWWWSSRYGTSGSWGPLAALGEGYLGVRLVCSGGMHYGWIHLQPTVVTEWAYETRPGVSIQAGAKPVPVPLASPEVVRPGYLRLAWPSETGTAYQVQTKARLDAFAWTNLSFVITATAVNSMVDLPISGQAQFFRVVKVD
jgi:hypothetical protein